jgi:hypothetical protein
MQLETANTGALPRKAFASFSPSSMQSVLPPCDRCSVRAQTRLLMSAHTTQYLQMTHDLRKGLAKATSMTAMLAA